MQNQSGGNWLSFDKVIGAGVFTKNIDSVEKH